jgi:hypothetical protein
MGRVNAGRVAGVGQVRGGRAGYRRGYGVGSAPAYGYAAPAYGYAAPAYGYAAPAYGYDDGYAPTYAYGPGAYGPGYGPVAPCLPIPLPVVGCY